ncbi:hypothetical protein [Mucilaginibacter sp. FT3.2]|uniref:hypothetical protein n=1 Tax=Mucilaginibacter sp. FT3.2 TaxID=2723090 RepID=UPI00160E2D1F|nr:hypothetical protein [Mucilaginibacter sp. FT3.2]MBB6234260.1 hypothetical protein [Mucilaginibacter sp. FT3.2]
MEISTFDLQALIRISSELGAVITLIKTGKLKPYLKKNEAFRLYGRKNVERWIEDARVTPRKDGDHSACWRIDRIEIESIAKSSQLLLHL